MDARTNLSSIDPEAVKSNYLNKKAPKSLRVTCYGSSSAKTPEAYLKAARSLGYSLAKRGHVCVNGAGPYGCMSAMNDGCCIGNGHIIGVIHEMFLVDSGYFAGKKMNFDDVGTHKAFHDVDPDSGIIRDILVAGGDDLQERKRLLVAKADALVVLPGGPGTWDELWEMACARHLGLTDLPIVCVNIHNYYEPFRQMLDRAYQDELIKLPPNQIVHFAGSVEEAIRWIEEESAGSGNKAPKKLAKRSSELNRSSFYSPPPLDQEEDDYDRLKNASRSTLFSGFQVGVAFIVGAALGTSLCTVLTKKY